MKTIQKNLIALKDLIIQERIDGEVVYQADYTNMIRAGRSQISLNVTESREKYSFTLQKNKKQISGSAINFNDAKIMIKELAEKIDLMPENPFLTAMEPMTGINQKNDLYDDNLEKIDPQTMVDIYRNADKIFSKRNTNNHISGSFSSGTYAYGIINTKTEVPLFHKGSDYCGEVVVQLNSHEKKEIQQMVVGEKLSDLSPNLNDLKGLYELTIKTPSKKIDEGRYDVIFSADAMGDLLAYFIAISGGEAKEYGYSYINDKNKIGEKLFGENITLSDCPENHPIFQRPFGHNGFKRENKDIIRKGVLTNLFYSDKTTCDRFNKKVNDSDSGSYNLVLQKGHGPTNFQSLVQQTTTPTVFINYIHYLNFVNYSEGKITGSSRFGTFLIENKKVTHNLNNVRINDDYFNLLNNVEWLSSASKNINVSRSYGFRSPCALNIPKFIKIKGVLLS